MAIKIKQKFPFLVLFCILAFVLFYHFSYFLPFTNNAFVVANVRPVAANVKGYVTDIYVKNEEYIKKGQPLFTVFKRPYELAYKKACSDVAQAQAELVVLTKQVEKTQHILQSQKENYEKFRFDNAHYKAALNDHAVSAIIAHTSLMDKNSALSQLKALEKELELNRQKIIVQEMKIKSLTAIEENAKVNLNETTVYAKANGTVQNMFVALGSPIKIRQPIFSFAETDKLFVQANFNETDLRYVRTGDKVFIFPRVYFGSKIYHGVIYSTNWSVSRIVTHKTSQIEIVTNSASNWFLLPQRLPVQIQITDYDPVHYPLNIGESAYVYVHTKSRRS